MRRLASISIVLCLLLALFSPAVQVAEAATLATPQALTQLDLNQMPSEPFFDNNFQPASPKWLNVVSNQLPATLNVDYQLADNVIQVNQTVTDSIADLGQTLSGSSVQKLQPNRIIEKGGYIAKSVLDAAVTQSGHEVTSGSIVVDQSTGTAFKVVSPTIYTGIFDADPALSEMVKPLENTYSLIKPSLHEVVKSFNMPEQTVTLNKANITDFAPNVESSMKDLQTAVPLAIGDDDKTFKTLTGDNLIELQFKDTALQGKVGSSTIDIKLSGGIAIDGIDLTGRYSSNGGYEISMTLQQECYIVAELDAEIHEEIKVPILGLRIPFGIGEVYGGIFAIIGMNGEFKLAIEARETNACRMGIGGGTFLYIPTSFHPIFEPQPPKINGDCSMLGNINGYVKFGPIMGIELFGFDLVGAGVLLGAGVNVQSDGSMLDIELYASIDVYIVLMDKYFSLVRARPTIYKKQQPDMHGYKVSFLEVYVNPGRVGGLIEEEPPQAGGAYVPAVNLEYRIWVVPRLAIGTFDPAKRESIRSADRSNTQKANKDKVRTYPDDAFARTNDEGEFIEKNDQICFGDDDVYLEFKGDGTTFFVGPATPVLPFTDVSITYADYFNDFITGKVEPKRLIRWESDRFDESQEQQELTYYQGPIYLSPFNDYGVDREIIPNASPNRNNKHRPYTICGTAQTDTNSQGEFDSRNAYSANGNQYPSGAIDVLSADVLNPYLPSEAPPGKIGVLASLDINEVVKNITVYGVTPAAPEFQYTRTLDLVENSYTKIISADGRIIDQMSYDEYLWISNPVGTRTITAEMFDYAAKGFSTQDYKGFYENPVTTTRENPLTLIPVLDTEGNPTGTALFAQRVTVEWVWQEHPNPIKITSLDHTQATAGEETTFQVTADGYFPRFGIIGDPQPVAVDKETGLMHIPNTLEPGVYTFTLEASEGNPLVMAGMPDPKDGNDSAPPDQQVFTLTVIEKPAVTPTPTPEPTPSARTAPEISGNETYTMIQGVEDLKVTFTATGSQPISFALAASSATGAPVTGITIDAATGIMTVSKAIATGYYALTITASNDVGQDTFDCGLNVQAPAARTAPVFVNRRDGYNFQCSPASNYTVQLKANGSTPIVYSLEPVNARIPVPAGVTIDAASGLLTVQGGPGGIKAGSYNFIARASNDVGSDTQECSLQVSTLYSRSMPLLLATVVKPQTGQTMPSLILTPDLFAKEPPPNKLTIRCNDPKDIYSHDRDQYDGAAFLCWDTEINISVIDVMVDTSLAQVYSDYTFYDVVSWGDEIIINDNSPVCDQYHYYDPESPFHSLPLSEEELAKIRATIKKAMQEKIAEYKNGYGTFNQDFSAGGLRDRVFDLTAHPFDEFTSMLDYGSTIKEINSQKNGVFEVALGEETGTVITGEYFNSLKGNPKASITFKQAGAGITFAGQDIKAANAGELINIGFTYAPHDLDMKESAGPGSTSFTYGFQHHGELPGLATFAITTTIDEGSQVNVYKFDAAANQFTMIAKGQNVGKEGVVTYKNNTMSEYLITTGIIADAVVSDVVNLQTAEAQPTNGWWLALAILAALLTGAGIWFLLRKKMAKNKEK